MSITVISVGKSLLFYTFRIVAFSRVFRNSDAMRELKTFKIVAKGTILFVLYVTKLTALPGVGFNIGSHS